MAAYYGQSLGRASTGGGDTSASTILPNGACSYRDLNAGPNAPTCGCRRFWVNFAHTAAHAGERAWCFCNHHACYHESLQASPGDASRTTACVTGSDGAADGHVVPITTQIQQNGPFLAPTWSELIRESAESQHIGVSPQPVVAAQSTTGVGLSGTLPRLETESVNQRLWNALNGFARQQRNEQGNGEDSDLPSTAVPSIVGGSRTRPEGAIPTTSERFLGTPVNIPHAQLAQNLAEELSATEVATPSVQGTPTFRTLPVQVAGPDTPPNRRSIGTSSQRDTQYALSRQRKAPASEASQSRRPPLTRRGTSGPSLSIQEMCNTIQDLGRRVNILESVSFNNMPSAEIQQNLDLVDARLLDLEHWRTDRDIAQDADDTVERLDTSDTRLAELEAWRLEKEQAGVATLERSHERLASKRKQSSIDLPDISSFDSEESFDLSAAAQTEAMVLAAIAANADTRPRIDALETRIAELEDVAPPSFARPWVVEVVLLPFGRQLHGLWFSASESTLHSQRISQFSQEWLGHRSSPNASFRAAAIDGSWTTESIEAWAERTEGEWLSPKACGPTGTCFQRLASRGLVRDLEFQAPDAGHILKTIKDAFGGLLNGEKDSKPESSTRFEGLFEPFVPLRKVRKSSRLRFLSPAEMVTPALWDAAFLESSVLMKTNGERRLYMTTPLAYRQPSHLCWSWRDVRHLPMYDDDGSMREAQVAGNVLEACWSYNDRLDHIASLPSSFVSQSIHSSRYSTYSENQEAPDLDTGVSSSPAPRQDEQRSVSVPSSISARAMGVEATPTRRVTSFDMDATSGNAMHSAKRRRVSASPEIERRGFAFTPRYSREPPSPRTSADVGPSRSSQRASSKGRSTTPFAYATPHSDMYLYDGGDTEADKDEVGIVSETGDYNEEWEGMQDAPPASSSKV